MKTLSYISLIFIAMNLFNQQIITSQNWNIQNTGITANLNGIFFYNYETGWAVGDSQTILKTNNGGSTWSSIMYNSVGLNGVFFITSMKGWVVGANGTIFWTNDGGTNMGWYGANSGTTNDLNSVFFIDNNTGWAVGNNGTVLKSTNSGQDWSVKTIGTTQHLFSVFFFNSITGWCVGNSGVVYKSTDAGETWFAQNSNTPQYLRSVFFTDVYTGWAVGSGSTIIKTTDSGAEWFVQPNGTSGQQFKSVKFLNSNFGLIVGTNGTILKTYNGGNAWNIINSSLTQTLTSVAIWDTTLMWIAGNQGLILKSGSTTGINNERYLPKNYELFQNYPNPFNPTTTIKFDIPNSSNVTLKIYNLLGQEVRTLVNGAIHAGYHSVIWDGKNNQEAAVSSGVYLYKLTSGSFIKTMKLMLLK